MKSHYIKLDIDKPEISKAHAERINKVKGMFGLDIINIDVHRSPSKKGWHIILEVVNDLSDWEIIIIQILMLSDFKREIYNTLRVKSGKFPNQSWNVMFTKKFILKGVKTTWSKRN